tara:strand:+ start:9580 stop:11097 length:1518 start_codon:yes stop_codon:yes gene_type:complete
MAVDVVWFKKDLRTYDHSPLIDAAKSNNPTLCLFAIEPERFDLEDVDPIHIEWELNNAIELSKSLEEIGGSLHFEINDIVTTLNKINSEFGIARILSHEETGNSWSFRRDKNVLNWCIKQGIEWIEYPTNGVIRKLSDRDLWKRKRDSRMRENLYQPPIISDCIDFQGDVPTMETMRIITRKLTNYPVPGQDAAFERLDSFLKLEAKEFQWAISSPTLAVKHGSGLSPYLAVGAISMRRVVQATNARMEYIRKNKGDFTGPTVWLKSLGSFRKRLAWRCHFVQKLEMEDNLDLVAQNPVIDSNLMRVLDEDRFTRWKNGTTGWPFLDACMRQLSSTGWINFRMRAMIMSAASYNLWLPWRETGCHLARQFLDYEPGIHWSQVGMQSGTTGINTIRAYSMTKQGRDQDPTGDYIRKWVPELAMVPTKFIHEPWEMPDELQVTISCIIGQHYPVPILDEVESRKEGIKRSYAARSSKESKDISKKVLKRHGSRSRPRKKRSNQKKLF